MSGRRWSVVILESPEGFGAGVTASHASGWVKPTPESPRPIRQRVIQVDAFTDRPFGGNPAAVCVMPGPRDEQWMQDVAREMNLSETAFLHPEGLHDVYRLRWFTPTVEVDLCGHATLATAHVLWSEGHLPAEAPAVRHAQWPADRRAPGWLDRARLPRHSPPHRPTGRPQDVRRGSRHPGPGRQAIADTTLWSSLDTELAVRSLKPDIAQIAAFPVRGLIVTARASTPGFDFVSRFFAPNVGVDEDPVCGSAHCCLGPFWSTRLGKSELVAYQASKRGGVLRIGVRATGSSSQGRPSPSSGADFSDSPS